ncbi:MAG: hypothetical protein IPK26_31905 [Planctomycetes bacterium]|nr:hypothetical protein [Planctomycetota bacterium]
MPDHISIAHTMLASGVEAAWVIGEKMKLMLMSAYLRTTQLTQYCTRFDGIRCGTWAAA